MYKLLTKTDIENIKEYRKCNKIVDEKVQEYQDKIIDEVYGDVAMQDLYDSSCTLKILSYEYENSRNGLELLIMGIIFSPIGLLYFNNTSSNKWITIVVGVLGLWLLVTGIKQINTRRKIKNNFKEMGVNYND